MPPSGKEGDRGEDRVGREYLQCVVGVINRVVVQRMGFENTRHVVV